MCYGTFFSKSTEISLSLGSGVAFFFLLRMVTIFILLLFTINIVIELYTLWPAKKDVLKDLLFFWIRNELQFVKARNGEKTVNSKSTEISFSLGSGVAFFFEEW